MEVMVAVDRKMQEYHGNNIQAYVLTLMSIVSNIYADASIGNSINVAVVHIFYLRDDLHMESNHNGKCFGFQIKSDDINRIRRAQPSHSAANARMKEESSFCVCVTMTILFHSHHEISHSITHRFFFS